VLGKAALYQALLEKFVAGQRNFATQLRAALDGGALETAERLAHGLKGQAASLGAEDLAAQAGALETALKDGAGLVELQAPLLELEASLRMLVEAIDRQIPAPSSRLQGRVDAEALGQLCESLAQLFADNDPRAGKLFAERSDLLRSAFDERYADIETAVRGYDFESALVALRDAARRWQISI
jgi:two-component system sensor histidine kinase/response regulator